MGPKPEVIGPNFTKLQASQAKEPKKQASQAKEPKKAKYCKTTSFSSRRAEKSKIFQYQSTSKQNTNQKKPHYKISIPKQA